MELLSPELMRLWKEWEIRVLVLLSLILQVVLIFSGNRRKFISRTRIRFLLWCAYLMADWVATVALGVLLNKLGEITKGLGRHRALNGNTDLAAFWAPFLLLHLGGPDTITAYALEDNELWLRHFLGLAVQTGVATYIIFLGWRGSHLSILTLPMFLVGIIKYGERTWALRSASNEQLRDSMLTPPDAGPNYSKFMEEFTLRQYEGFYVRSTSNEVIIEARVQVEDDPKNGTSSMSTDADLLNQAYNLFRTFRRLFVNLILSFQDRDSSLSLFGKMTYKEAFKVIEIELGFMFDVLYTKGAIYSTRVGCYLRFISLSITFVVLVLFSFFHEKNHTKKTDLAITFLLLVVAVLLEIYSILLLVSSDWADLYLEKNAKIKKAVDHFRLGKYPRWSNSLAQHSLLSFCLKSKPKVGIKIHKLFGINKILEEHQLKTIEEVSTELKESIFIHLKEKFEHMSSIAESIMYESELKALCTCRGDRALKNSGLFEDLVWSVEVEFDQSILIWHIATDLCYHCDETQKGNDCQISKQLSHYMLYLLVMRPFMLPMGIGKIRYLDTCEELKSFLKERESMSGDIHSSNARSRIFSIPAMNPFGRGKSKPDQTEACSGVLPNSKGKSKPVETKACEMLLNVNTVVPPITVKGDRSKSVLFDACRLASQLQNSSDKRVDWKLVSDVWIEMLSYAASRCSGHDHARQLGQGGELLTHVWLLMAHFGLTEQFQISRGHARARLMVQ
ncbi:hypothetical protein OIU85_011911 [Salix viminalis]|uniref:DUF4220 domain-containing protein n=1 Tax=Salix viminalis TaxID=40686 RepID=A0A9Q0NTQ5_SALVM|nr:hypothetical protein OIU85_011911 [Salix viminalis]